MGTNQKFALTGLSIRAKFPIVNLLFGFLFSDGNVVSLRTRRAAESAGVAFHAMSSFPQNVKLRRWLVLLVFLPSLISGCRASVTYKPPLLPVKISIDSTGNVTVAGEASLVTPIGTFSIGADYAIRRADDSIIVNIRDRKSGFDKLYNVRTGGDEFVAVVNGSTTIQVVNRQVIIDVTAGSVQTIEFRKATDIVQEQSGLKPFVFGYQPFALAKWAYENANDNIGYLAFGIIPVGFVVYVIRLLGTIILLVVDLLLIIFLGIGVLLESFVGVTARNIYFAVLGVVTVPIAIGVLLGPLIILFDSNKENREMVPMMILVWVSFPFLCILFSLIRNWAEMGFH